MKIEDPEMDILRSYNSIRQSKFKYKLKYYRTFTFLDINFQYAVLARLLTKSNQRS